jgi:hypothetical protein
MNLKVTGFSRKFYMEQFHNNVLYGKYYCGDEVKDEIRGACSMHERIKMHT